MSREFGIGRLGLEFGRSDDGGWTVAFGRGETVEKGHPASEILSRILGFGGTVPDAANLSADMKAYQVSSWIYSCVYAIASSASGLPLRLWRAKGHDRAEWEPVYNHPVLDILAQPNEDAHPSDVDLLEALFSDLELAGEWFLYLNTDSNGRPVKVYQLRPDCMKVVAGKDRLIKGYVLQVAGETIAFNRDEIIHNRTYNPISPYRGQGALEAARLAVTVDVQSQLSNRTFFKHGAVLQGVLESDQALTKDVVEALKISWKKAHSGVSKAHRTAILEQGIKYKPIGISPKDMDFVQLRKMSREEIMSCFRVPPCMVGVFEYANYANSQEQKLSFWHETMIPKLRKAERALTRGLCGPFGDDLVLEFDLGGVHALIKNDLEMAEMDTKLVINGISTINERRRARHLGPDLPWGNEWHAPFTLQPIDGAGQGGPYDNKPTSESDGKSRSASQLPAGCRALYPTSEFKKARSDAWEVLLAPLRAQFARAWKRDLAKLEDGVVAAIEASGKSTIADIETWLFQYETSVDGTVKAMRPHLMHAANEAGLFAIGELGLDIDFNLADPRVQRAIEEKVFKFAREVNETTLDKLRTSLGEGIQAGETHPELIKRVNAAFDGRKGNAADVAQTEVGSICNSSSMEGWRQSGVVEGKGWHAGGPNPRAHHAKANGQVVGLDEKFVVMGEEMSYPGDPAGSAKNVCGCHCSMLPVLKE